LKKAQNSPTGIAAIREAQRRSFSHVYRVASGLPWWKRKTAISYQRAKVSGDGSR